MNGSLAARLAVVALAALAGRCFGGFRAGEQDNTRSGGLSFPHLFFDNNASYEERYNTREGDGFRWNTAGPRADEYRFGYYPLNSLRFYRVDQFNATVPLFEVPNATAKVLIRRFDRAFVRENYIQNYSRGIQTGIAQLDMVLNEFAIGHNLWGIEALTQGLWDPQQPAPVLNSDEMTELVLAYAQALGSTLGRLRGSASVVGRDINALGQQERKATRWLFVQEAVATASVDHSWKRFSDEMLLRDSPMRRAYYDMRWPSANGEGWYSSVSLGLNQTSSSGISEEVWVEFFKTVARYGHFSLDLDVQCPGQGPNSDNPCLAAGMRALSHTLQASNSNNFGYYPMLPRICNTTIDGQWDPEHTFCRQPMETPATYLTQFVVVGDQRNADRIYPERYDAFWGSQVTTGTPITLCPEVLPNCDPFAPT